MKKIAGEFKKFITRGNIVDMAVGVIVGSAFTAIVTALTNSILKPLINGILYLIMGKGDATNIYTFLVVEKDAVSGAIDLTKSIYIDWGAFINAFINFITARKIEKKIDYLLLTSYYFTQYEQKPRFTLKQLNAKLMQNLAVIIDHSVLQEAINRSYIECLPDLTGLVGTSEYRLTAYGEKVLLDE